MDLFNAAQHESLKVVEKSVKSQETWTDYQALNNALVNGDIDKAKFLLKKHCRVNKPIAANILESTPLHKAVKLKDRDLIKLLLQSGASITAVYLGDNTPLHLAFIAGLTDVVNLMIKYIGLISEFTNCKNDIGLSHLHIACTTENSEVIEKYLTTNVNVQDIVSKNSPKWAGYTAYHFAIKFRSLAAISNLSKNRLDDLILKKDKSGQTPHELACTRLVEYSILTHAVSEQQEKRSYYFQGQSNVSKCKVVDQPTAFHLACMRDDPHIVKTFICHGAPVNIPVSEEVNLCPLYSPLHFAVESGVKETVKLLLEYGADLNWINGYKMTALHLAMYNEKNGWPTDVTNFLYSKIENKEEDLKDNNRLSYFHIAVSRNDLELVEKMLDTKQVDVNAQVSMNHRGFSLYTPLHFAVLYGYEKMMKLLVEHDADVNVMSSRGTALQLAVETSEISKAFSMFELLLESGAKAGRETLIHKVIHEVTDIESHNRDPTERYGMDPTPLLDFIGRLIELGCDLNSKDEDGNTALYFASRDSNLCVKRLLEYGADVNVENYEGDCVHFFPFQHFKLDDAEMYHHLQNLKALGRKINPKLEEDCSLSLKQWVLMGSKDDESDEDDGYGDYKNSNYEEELTYYESKRREEDRYYEREIRKEEKYNRCFASIQKKRLNEVKEMKKMKLDKKTTLYDFMRLEGEENLSAYARNEVLESFVEELDLSIGYSMYKYLIKLQYRKSQEYAKRREPTKRSLRYEDAGETRRKHKRFH